MIPLIKRPRRNRRTQGIRNLLRETQVHLNDLVAPLFLKEGLTQPEPILSLPGINRYNPEQLITEATRLSGLGIQAVALFPCQIQKFKDPTGSEALNPHNLINTTLRELKKTLPELTLITDVALDPYTSHGHDGLLDSDGNVDNDPSAEVFAKMAVLQAAAGADYVAPSDMMDGRIGVIRQALDQAGFTNTGIIAYAAKFASAYYGPFRDAVGSQPSVDKPYLDKSTYQLDPANRREALLDALLDEEQGADVLMVKPAGLYLDVLQQLRLQTRLPLAAYQVSGEYAQIHAAAHQGWLNLNQARDESLLAIKRAGADLIFTYFATAIAEEAQRKNL